MSNIPRIYGPNVRKILFPIAVALLVGWLGVEWTQGDSPSWFQVLTVVAWLVLVNSREKADSDGNLLTHALAFSSQLVMSGLIALLFAIVVIAKEPLELVASHAILFVLLFTIIGEVAYSYLRRLSIGSYWVRSVVPVVLWVLLAIRLIGN